MVGDAEPLEADEDLTTEGTGTLQRPLTVSSNGMIPQAQPTGYFQQQQAQPQQQAQQLQPQTYYNVSTAQPMAQPMPMAMAQPMPMAQVPFQSGGFNMGAAPAIYATPMPQQAQMFSSGVPGAPVTFSVSTDDQSMQFGGASQGPRPQRGGVTLKRRTNQGYSDEQGGQSTSQSGGGPGVTITVIKGS